MRDQELSHFSTKGEVRMVEVSAKPATARRAVAAGRLYASREAVAALREGNAPKGDPFAVARVAAILGAKRTPEWIPLAHPIALTGVHVDIEVDESEGAVLVRVETATVAPTGVEMEALTGVTAALLTLYDMLKAVDRSMTIGPVVLLEKSGGRSGTFRRGEDSVDDA